jgi:release factor glutamine methyltransferase
VRRQEFYGLDLSVTPDVLIPRPETEILVEAAIAEIANIRDPLFCEIGIGSGCISVAILHNVPRAHGLGIDISDAALEVARSNAEQNHVIGRLDLRLGDVFEGVEGHFHLIVSNPPYVPEAQIDLLQEEVREYEPHTALSGGTTGLDVIERIVRNAQHFLLPGGVLLMEIGFDQADAVSRLLAPEIWSDIGFLDDLQGIPRILFARRVQPDRNSLAGT